MLDVKTVSLVSETILGVIKFENIQGRDHCMYGPVGRLSIKLHHYITNILID